MNAGYCQQHGQYQMIAQGCCPYCAQLNQQQNGYWGNYGQQPSCRYIGGAEGLALSGLHAKLDEIIKLLKDGRPQQTNSEEK